MKKNGFAPLVIILLIAILGVAGYFFYKNNSSVINNPSFLYYVRTGPGGQTTNSFFKSNLLRKNETNISSYFTDYLSISVSPNGKYITRENGKVLEISSSKDLLFKQIFSISDKKGEIVQTRWSSDSTAIAVSITNENNSDTGLFGEVSKTIYLIEVGSMKIEPLHTFEKGTDLSMGYFDGVAHTLYISESPASTGIIISETFSSVNTITGEIKSEDLSKIVTSFERTNGHKYFEGSENEKGILYDLDLSKNTKNVVLDTKGGQIKQITYLPPANQKFVFTGWTQNVETGRYGKYTFYVYDINTRKLSILAEDINGENYPNTSPDGRYIFIMPSIADNHGSDRVFDMITKKLTTVDNPKTENVFYIFYWISD